MKQVAVLLLLFFSQNLWARNILLTGYWPPTNEMLRDFNKKLNPLGWKGENWENSGHDVHAFYPKFSSGDVVGEGNFPVDFVGTYNSFMEITQRLKPVAIISFGRGTGMWKIENIFYPHFQKMFETGEFPASGQKLKYQIPSSLRSNQALRSTLPHEEIMNGIPDSTVNETGPGDFLCGFISYLGAWYKTENNNPNIPGFVAMTGFVHIGTTNEEYLAQGILHTLRTVVKALNQDPKLLDE